MLNERLLAGIVGPYSKVTVTMPTWGEAMDEFTAALTAPPQPPTEADADKAALLRAVGLRD